MQGGRALYRCKSTSRFLANMKLQCCLDFEAVAKVSCRSLASMLLVYFQNLTLPRRYKLIASFDEVIAMSSEAAGHGGM